MVRRIIFCLLTAGVLIACDGFTKKSEEIPFSYERHVYMKCTIDDSIIGSFMFDTGANGLYLDSTFNENSGVKYRNYTPYFLPGTAPEMKYQLKFAINSFTDTPKLINIINTKSSFGKQCDGIIGWEHFRNYVVQVDYKKSSLKITHPDDFTIDDSFTKIPLIFRHNLYFINAEVMISDQLKIKGEYVLDLGFGGSIYFTGESTRKYKIDSQVKAKCEFGDYWGLDKIRQSTGFVFRGKSIKIDGFELNEPTLECSNDTVGVLSKGEFIGLLGNRALEHFDVIIDFPNQMLYLKPNTEYKKRMTFKSLGVGFVDRTDICDGWIVTTIYNNSDADIAGIKSYDIITHLNGKAVKENSSEMIKELYKDVSKDVALTVKRDTVVLKFNLKLKEELK